MPIKHLDEMCVIYVEQFGAQFEVNRLSANLHTKSAF